MLAIYLAILISIQMNVLGSMDMCKIARYKCTGKYDSGYAYRNLCQKVKCGGEKYKFQCTDHFCSAEPCEDDFPFSNLITFPNKIMHIFKHSPMKKCLAEKYHFKTDAVIFLPQNQLTEQKVIFFHTFRFV